MLPCCRTDWWPPWILLLIFCLASAADVSDICTRCSCQYLQSAHITETICTEDQVVLDVNCTTKPKVSENSNQFSIPHGSNVSLLVWLSFDGSNMMTIERNTFVPFGKFNVTNLSMDNNNLLIIPGNAFSKLKNLTVLSLTNNKIITFSSDSIKPLGNLRELDLSWNKLTEIDLSITLDSRNLEHFDVSHNAIEALTVPITGTSSLQVLDLSDNRIQLLPLKAFSSFPKLVILNISNNNISYVSPDLFEDLTRLQVLDLSLNRLKVIDSETVVGLGSLIRIHLNHNYLTEVNFAKALKTLNTLDVGFNNISSFGNDTLSEVLEKFIVSHNLLEDLNGIFQIFPNLKSLDASYNPCSKFPDHVRAGLRELILDGTMMTSWPAQFPGEGSITHLSMSNITGLRSLGPNAFSGIIKSRNSTDTEKCATLKISHTSLEDIDEEAFKNLDLCKLDLSYNRLRWIPEQLMDWASMVGVDLQGNPWNCVCSLQWMVNIIIPATYKADRELLEELRCATPEYLRGKRLVHWYNRPENALCGKNKKEIMLETKPLAEQGITDKIIMSSSPIMIAVFVFLGCIAVLLVLLGFALQRRAIKMRRVRKNRRF
uniref:LRRCT domain-containing protein n=1 Tax=Clastoptera arizonana TaxID=38151 RepID=A0A1B6D6Q5_9HEMI